MSESQNKTKISDSTGKILGWIAIIAGIIGFFWAPLWMSIIAIVLGFIGLFSSQRTLNVIGLIIGIIALIVYLV